MKRIKKIIASVLCLTMLFSNQVLAATAGGTTGEGENTGVVISTGKTSDVNLQVPNAPSGKAGETIGFRFILTPDGGVNVNKVYIDVASEFGFESGQDAYKETVPENGAATFECNYNLTAKSTLETGYYPVNFIIEYTKGSESYILVKPISARVEGIPVEEPTTEAPVDNTPGTLSTPRLIVTGYETSPATVKAGQDFTITIHVKNTSKRTAVSNIKFTVKSAENEFLPKSGSSTVFVDKIGSGKTEDIVIEMKAKGDLEQKPYVLNIAAVYEDSSANPFEASEDISIPVSQEARLTVTDISLSSDFITVYEQANVMFSINNLGKGILYNVSVSFKGNSIESEPSYVGNIAAGGTGFADSMITGIAATEDDGIIKAIISYEDADGEVKEFEQDITLFVGEDMGNGDFYEEEMYIEEEATGISALAVLGIIAGICIAVAVVIIVVVIIIKKRKGKEEVDEDELS